MSDHSRSLAQSLEQLRGDDHQSILNAKELLHATDKADNPEISQVDRRHHDLCVLMRQQQAIQSYSMDPTAQRLPDPDEFQDIRMAEEKQTSLTHKLARSSWVLNQARTQDKLERWSFACRCTQDSHARRGCIRLATSARFDKAILVLILAGTLLMTLDTPDVAVDNPSLKRGLVSCDEILLYVFTFEMVVKMIAFGLVQGQRTYLRDHWGRLDALVVLSGWAALITNQFGVCQVPGLLLCAEASGGAANFRAIRTIRVLRPLKTVKQLRGMQVQVQALLKSLPELIDSMVLCGFILVLFGVVGVQLFMGGLQQRCINDHGHINQEVVPCSLNQNLQQGMCPTGFTCKAGAGQNPNYGITSFDNLPEAMLAIFQSITLEGWVDIMYKVRGAYGLKSDIFFLAMVLFGSLLMTNLIVAVLVSNFMDVTKENSMASFKERGSKNTVSLGAAEMSWARRTCRRIADSTAFSSAIMSLILFNTLTLALENLISEGVLEDMNYVFTGIFALEMVIKLVGLGPRLYAQDGFNVFDGTIVVFSLVEIAVSKALGLDGASVTLLRTFRLLRVLKLFKSMKSLRKILDTVMMSLRPILYIGILMLLFIWVFALLGMTLFGVSAKVDAARGNWFYEERGPFQGRLTRPNFSNFFNSIVTVFIVITGENWNEVMYATVYHCGWLSPVFFVIVVVCGKFITLNLFLAVLVDNFNRVNNNEIMNQRESRSAPSIRKLSKMVQDPLTKFCAACVSALCPGRSSSAVEEAEIYVPSPRGRTSGEIKKIVDTYGFTGSSLFLFGKHNLLRSVVWKLIRHAYFEQFIFVLLAVSSLNLALDAPSVSDPDAKEVLFAMDCVVTTIFTVEAMLKILALGFAMGPCSYCRDYWNVLDFFVVLTSILNILAQGVQGGARQLAFMKGLRALRALRPLRMVSRNEGMKAVVLSIFMGIPAMLDVVIVMLLFLGMFSILGVQLFKNQFARCSCQEWCPEKKYNSFGRFANVSPSQLCSGICQAAVRAGAPTRERTCSWGNHQQWNFDNVVYAALTLFEVSTLEMWPSVMWMAIDGQKDQGPEYNANSTAAMFFLLFLFFMSFFILNLFVGIVIDKFQVVRNKMNGLAVLNEAQLRWIKTQRMLVKIRPRPLLVPPDSKWRQLALQLISLREFEVAILGMIIANTLVLCTTYYQSPAGVGTIQENANSVFLAVYSVEALLKVAALHPRLYFMDPWNIFDLSLVVGSLFSVLAQYTYGNDALDATVLRIFRIARLFRLIKSLKSLRVLAYTLVKSLPSLVNVGTMLFILFFVYAVAGMALFGDIQIEGNMELKHMSQDVNFASFYMAACMLFRMSTGESWNGIMHDCFSGARCAEPPHAPNCGNTAMAIIYFVSFMLVGSFVFINLFIAVIIEKHFDNLENSVGDVAVSEADAEQFVAAWSRLSPTGHSYMPTELLPQLLQSVNPPLGFRGEVISNTRTLQILRGLGIRDHGGYVHFAETLWRLASMVVGTDMRPVSTYEVVQSLDDHVIRRLPAPRNAKMGSVMYDAAHVAACLKVQSRWRANKARAHFRKTIQLALGKQSLEQGALQEPDVVRSIPCEPRAWAAAQGGSSPRMKDHLYNEGIAMETPPMDNGPGREGSDANEDQVAPPRWIVRGDVHALLYSI